MVKCLPEFPIFTVFLKNKNIISKIRRSKVTDYAALTFISSLSSHILKDKFGSTRFLCLFYSIIFSNNVTQNVT